MKLYRTRNGSFISSEGSFYRLEGESWDALIARDDLYDYCLAAIEKASPSGEFSEAAILPPVESQRCGLRE